MYKINALAFACLLLLGACGKSADSQDQDNTTGRTESQEISTPNEQVKENDPFGIKGMYFSSCNCAGATEKIYFMSGNRVYLEECGMESTIFSYKIGTWQPKNGAAEITFHTYYTTTGKQVESEYSRTGYTVENLKAKRSKINEKMTFEIPKVIGEENSDDCTYFDKNTTYSIDVEVQEIMRLKFNRQFPEASKRALSAAELADYSKKDLRIMRNEIFASYAYKFNSKDLNEHFSKYSEYFGVVEDVNALLTDLENKNVQLIVEEEKKR